MRRHAKKTLHCNGCPGINGDSNSGLAVELDTKCSANQGQPAVESFHVSSAIPGLPLWTESGHEATETEAENYSQWTQILHFDMRVQRAPCDYEGREKTGRVRRIP